MMKQYVIHYEVVRKRDRLHLRGGYVTAYGTDKRDARRYVREQMSLHSDESLRIKKVE